MTERELKQFAIDTERKLDDATPDGLVYILILHDREGDGGLMMVGCGDHADEILPTLKALVASIEAHDGTNMRYSGRGIA